MCIYTYICITESLSVQQKLTQHCKYTILQFKKIASLPKSSLSPPSTPVSCMFIL